MPSVLQPLTHSTLGQPDSLAWQNIHSGWHVRMSALATTLTHCPHLGRTSVWCAATIQIDHHSTCIWYSFQSLSASSTNYGYLTEPVFSPLLVGLVSWRRQFPRLATSRPSLTHSLIRGESSSDGVASLSDVSRERSTCFTCRDVNQSVNFWREKYDWHFSVFMCSARDRRGENRRDSHQNFFEWYCLSPINSKEIICVQCMDVVSNIDKRRKLFHLVTPPGLKRHNCV